MFFSAWKYWKVVSVVGALAAFGLLREGWQFEIYQAEKAQDLINFSDKSLSSRDFAFVSLGGLRTILAAYLALETHEDFSRSDWVALEEKYRRMVELAPHNIYYWDSGAWQMVNNASAWYLRNGSGGNAARQMAYRKEIFKGREFLKEGIKQNPKSWKLWSLLAVLEQNPERLPDIASALDSYRESISLGAPLSVKYDYLLLLSAEARRSKNSLTAYKEAYQLARELYAQPDFRYPILCALVFALQNEVGVSDQEKIPIEELFPKHHLKTSPDRVFLRRYVKGNLTKGLPIRGLEQYLD